MVSPMEGFADTWRSGLLKQVYGFDPKTANYLTSMIYIGMCFAPLLSRIAEKTGSYIQTIAGPGAVMLTVFTMLVTGILDFKSITVGFFILGICCAYQILAIYKASTYLSENVTGLTTAVANMIIMSFGYVFYSIIGIMIKSYNAAGEVSAFSYRITIIPITSFIGTIGFFNLIRHYMIQFLENIKNLIRLNFGENSKSPSINPVISTKTASHYFWGDNYDGWWLKKNGKFTVISEMLPPDGSEIKHFHSKTEQFFYVLEGALNIDLDGKNYHLQQHEGITVIPHVIHKVLNQSNQNVRFLVISCPDSHGDRVDLEE